MSMLNSDELEAITVTSNNADRESERTVDGKILNNNEWMMMKKNEKYILAL